MTLQRHLLNGSSVLLTVIGMAGCSALHADRPSPLRAGAYAQDIAPTQFPVIVNGMFLSRTADRAHDPLYAKALVLDDGDTRLALVVVDSCMMPRDVIDRAKLMACESTGIPVERMLVSATHTHSAPSVMNGCLGTDADPAYTRQLPGMIAQAIERAAANLEPAEIGWGVVDDFEHTHNRRWIRRPDRPLEDPFGETSVRANMHPGYQSPDVVGPSGPVDPGLTVLSVQAADGRPLALLANYSMHYFGSPMLSADYFGVFARRMCELIGGDETFVGMMSQGTSGDLMWMDYGAPARELTAEQYTEGVARKAYEAYKSITYRDRVPLAMAERKITLRRRVPDEPRVAWAKQVAAGIRNGVRATMGEVYAHQQLWLVENPATELRLQALRIGDLGIAALPNEVYAITGLKLKALSPLKPTMNIELANGAEGYIPPPEQHALGGYTTWACSTAGLEVQAEPRIVQTLVELLEEVSGKPSTPFSDPRGAHVEAVLAAKPAAYWRMSAIGGDTEPDITGHGPDGRYEPGVAFYLPGPEGRAFSKEQMNRAAHFAGGRMAADLPLHNKDYSVQMWFWNGLPHDSRPVTGYLFSHGEDGAEGAPGDHLGIGGTLHAEHQGRLLVFNGDRLGGVAAGRTVLVSQTWNYVAMVRRGGRVSVYLNGDPSPEIDAALPSGAGPDARVFIGGRSDNFANFEGKIDEVAVFRRCLTPREIARHRAQARIVDKPPG